jgi:carbon monoxide dehydrogenase subunit G
MEFSHEVVINKDREEVWKIFDNPDNLKKWQPTLKSFEPQSGQPGQVGATSKLIYEENGREIVLTETIKSRDYPQEFSGSYSSSHVTNNLTNKFLALDDGATKWVMDCEVVFHALLLKMFGPLMKGAFVKRVTGDMNRFNEFAERQ